MIEQCDFIVCALITFYSAEHSIRLTESGPDFQLSNYTKNILRETLKDERVLRAQDDGPLRRRSPSHPSFALLYEFCRKFARG